MSDLVGIHENRFSCVAAQGVCRDIPVFLIFAAIHSLSVLVRTASARQFKRVPTIYVLSKNKKNVKTFQQKIFNFYSFRKICLLHWRVFAIHFFFFSIISNYLMSTISLLVQSKI